MKLDTVGLIGRILFREKTSTEETPRVAVVILERIDINNGRQAKFLHPRKAPAPIIGTVVQEVFLAGVCRVLGTERNDLAIAKHGLTVLERNAERQVAGACLSGLALIRLAAGLNGSKDNETSKCRSEEHTTELQSLRHLVCRLLL